MIFIYQTYSRKVDVRIPLSLGFTSGKTMHKAFMKIEKLLKKRDDWTDDNDIVFWAASISRLTCILIAMPFYRYKHEDHFPYLVQKRDGRWGLSLYRTKDDTNGVDQRSLLDNLEPGVFANAGVSKNEDAS